MTVAAIVGLGVTGRAVAERLLDRGVDLVVIEDRPTDEHRALARAWNARFLAAPDRDLLGHELEDATVVLPSPGVPDDHPIFTVAHHLDIPIAGEFDLARRWDQRPLVAVTGTDGKTTVTTLVTEMLLAAGRTAMAAGNTEIPLVAAIDDPTVEVFVVEASSFRLGHACRFEPQVAAWLNWGPDHLDVHHDLDAYLQAKTKIWRHLRPGGRAVANADDEVVMAHRPAADVVTFSIHQEADYRLENDHLLAPSGASIPVAGLPRALPHDLANALAAWACVDHLGVAPDAVAEVLRRFTGLAHRVQTVAVQQGITFVDDSKATVPHAVLAAVAAFESVVLIAGGRNKGLDLTPLAGAAPRLRAVVAIGEAAADIAAVFEDHCPVEVGADMDDAVRRARRLARSGDTVLLSPGCASFDWYRDYGERGRDFVRAVGAAGGR